MSKNYLLSLLFEKKKVKIRDKANNKTKIYLIISFLLPIKVF